MSLLFRCRLEPAKRRPVSILAGKESLGYCLFKVFVFKVNHGQTTIRLVLCFFLFSIGFSWLYRCGCARNFRKLSTFARCRGGLSAGLSLCPLARFDSVHQFFSCTLKDLAYDFAAAQPLGHLFVPVSAFLSCLGLLGLVSLLRRNQTGCFVVRALAGLSAFVAIGNWIAYALGITVYGSVSSVAFWIPTASVFWSLTYCLAASRIRADRTSAN
jgi:hypothetical protein